MPLPFTITHHGATTGVTGSCHQLTLNYAGVFWLIKLAGDFHRTRH